MRHITRSLLALLPFILVPITSYAERLLIDDRDHRVSLYSQLDCDSVSRIRIDSTQPDLYENDTRQLQRIADAVQAMLNYECPKVNEISILGMLRGLEEPVYHGQVLRQDNWLVHALPLPASLGKQISEDKAGDESGLLQSAQAIHSALSLAQIKLGMQIDEVSESLYDRFNKKPEYDDQRGVMTLHTNGCPNDFDFEQHKDSAQAGWKCLEARFSDRRIPTLEQLEIVQVARSDRDSIYQLLVERYGTPTNSITRPQQHRTELSWSTETGQLLQADLRETDSGHTVTELKLSEQGRSQAGRDLADLGLTF